MATVDYHGRGYRVRCYAFNRTYTTTVRGEQTKANLRTLERRAFQLETRLRDGEPWEDIRAALRGETPTKPPGTLGYYWQRALDTADVQPGTMTHYENTYDRIWSVFDDRDVRTIKKSELQARLAEFGYTPKARRSAVSVLRQAFLEALDDETITSMPTENWRTKERHQKPVKRPYSVEERDLLLADLKSRWDTAYRFFLLGFYTGMRTEELLAIQRQHIKPGQRIIVEQVRTGNRLRPVTKTHTARSVFVPDPAWSIAVEPYRFHEWLFTGEKGKPFTQANKVMQAYGKAHEATGVERRLNVSGHPMPYVWRCTYVSLSLAGGARPYLVAEQIGDDLQTMLREYAAFIPKAGDERALQESIT